MPDTSTTLEALRESEHTPTPWYLDDDVLQDEEIRILGPRLNCTYHGNLDTWLVADVGSPAFWDDSDFKAQDQANAAFIVEAVNSHAALVAENAALKRALESDRERLADILDARALAQPPGPRKLCFSLAARIVRRGRDLTSREQLENLMRFLNYPEDALTPKSPNTDIPTAGGEG